MSKDQVKPNNNRKLNDSQIQLLSVLYKFRFGTRELLAESTGRQNTSAFYTKLSVLVKHEYISVRFSDEDRKLRRPVKYYLLPKGLQMLYKLGTSKLISSKAVKSGYRDKSVTQGEFIDRCLQLFTIANRLQRLHPGLQFFTKRELSRFEYLPDPRPDAYMVFNVEETARRYLLEMLSADSEPFLINRRLRQLITYHQDERWAKTKKPFPPVLFVCTSTRQEKLFVRLAQRAQYKADNDMKLYSTFSKVLLEADNENDAAWAHTTEPTVRHSLRALS